MALIFRRGADFESVRRLASIFRADHQPGLLWPSARTLPIVPAPGAIGVGDRNRRAPLNTSPVYDSIGATGAGDSFSSSKPRAAECVRRTGRRIYADRIAPDHQTAERMALSGLAPVRAIWLDIRASSRLAMR